MQAFKNAKWIWIDDKFNADEYAVFQKEFDYVDGELTLKICAETNYVAYLNGKMVAYGQFAGYKHVKYYDTIDLSKDAVKGNNVLKITVWYEGLNSFTHIEDGAGLIFEVSGDKGVICFSDKNTLGAIDADYVGGEKRLVTIQLGYTSSKVSGAKPNQLHACVETGREVNILPRPVKKLVDYPRVEGKLLDIKNKLVYDLGREEAGYLFCELDCEQDCLVKISYGEHIFDGQVRRLIPGGYKGAGRDFSLDFICKKGVNKFENRFVRLAGRYLQVECDKKVKVNAVGLTPVHYPVTEKPSDFLSGLDKNIYDTCVRTLRLCMHEHYEDCPWREQALYSLDSRNQMLCGYYAFNEREFQRENLVFISHGKRSDGLLEITYPAVETPAIPFFSLIYIVAVNEYVDHTGDTTIIDEVWQTVSGIANVFINRLGNGALIKNLPAPYWNFYEWSKGSDNDSELIDDIPRVEKTELLLNCAFVYSMNAYENLCKIKGEKYTVDTLKVKDAIQKTFYDKDKNLYFLSDVDNTCSQLGNAFALLIGLGNSGVAEAIKNDKTLVPATLSMLGFVYDALLKNGQNEQFILDDIRRNYKYMLDNGATSFWENLDMVGELSSACSLCHGWSAIPVYYYNKILKK